MYKYLVANIDKLMFGGIALMILSQCYVLGSDLGEEIYSKFHNYYKGWSSDAYISDIYSPNPPKDPFGEAVSNIEDRKLQVKIAGAEHVEELLHEKGCNLSQKKIRSILYYYVPEFRSELARGLKQELGDYDSKKYVLDKDEVFDYCKEYYVCYKSEGSITPKTYLELMKISKISARTPENIETNCKEFFESNYKKGENNEKINQNVKTVQMGGDRYWNATTDDSSYDIMSDLGMLSKLLYEEAEDPITPVLYNIPIFSNSKKELGNNKNDSPNNNVNSITNTPVQGKDSIDKNPTYTNPTDTKPFPSLNGGNNIQPQQDNTQNPNTYINNSFDNSEIYDKLVEGLNGYSVVGDDTNFYKSLCVDEEKNNAEPEPKTEIGKENIDNTDSFGDLTEEDYKELVDYMLESVDKYTVLPEEIEQQVKNESENIDNYSKAQTSSQLQDVANEIKKCRESCEGLRIDQKASCMLKCACGEVESPIFDPDSTPGLGPIYMIRFCAVPGVDMRFSVGGKRIHSIEEGVKEIYGVVDKLSREGRLGKWTQQYEFLDSSTKQINFPNTIAFSISIDFVNIINNMPVLTKQYQDLKIDSDNERRKQDYNVSSPLDNPISKNTYRIVSSEGETIRDIQGKEDADKTRKTLSELYYSPKTIVDGLANSDANRYSKLSESLGRWMDQQGSLRTQISTNISDLNSYSESLRQKKCK